MSKSENENGAVFYRVFDKKPEEIFLAWTEEDGKPYELFTGNPLLHTPEGAHVGMRLDELMSKYTLQNFSGEINDEYMGVADLQLRFMEYPNLRFSLELTPTVYALYLFKSSPLSLKDIPVDTRVDYIILEKGK